MKTEQSFYFKIGKSLGFSKYNSNHKNEQEEKVKQRIELLSSKSRKEIEQITQDIETLKVEIVDLSNSFLSLRQKMVSEQTEITQKLLSLKEILEESPDKLKEHVNEIILKNNHYLEMILGNINNWNTVINEYTNLLASRSPQLFSILETNHEIFIGNLQTEWKNLNDLEAGFQLGSALRKATDELK